MLSDIKNEIKGLNPNKATTHNNIPSKILRQRAEVTANTLQLPFNNAISYPLITQYQTVRFLKI